MVIEAGEGLRGKLDFWGAYHSWSERPGPGVLLHHLLGVDLRGFNPRAIPRTDALRQQIEHTALRDPLTSSPYSAKRAETLLFLALSGKLSKVLKNALPSEQANAWARYRQDRFVDLGLEGLTGPRAVYRHRRVIKVQQWPGGFQEQVSSGD